MSDNQHTPGPWRYSDGMIQCRSRWSDGEGKEYLDWRYPRILATVTEDWDEAVNARLIAAAPDLLAACRDALEVEEDMAQCPDSELAKRLRAAIAKATGKDA